MTWFGNSLKTMEQEVNEYGTYEGRTANIGFMLARRDQGWSSTTVMGDLCGYLDTSQASANTPVVGTTYYVISTSAQDGVGGTGIRSVKINLLDGSGNRSIVTATLNGTTAVSIGNNISHIQYMESEVVGSSGVAAGTISISNVAAIPTVAQTFSQIRVGDGRSLDGVFKVPTGWTAYVLGWNVRNISKTDAMDTRLRATIYTHDHTLSPGYHFQQVAYLAANTGYEEDLHYWKLPAGAIMKISTIPGAVGAANRCDGSFHFLLVSNT